MIRVITSLDAESLAKELSGLGPSIEVIAIYAINLMHFAWLRDSEPRTEKKGKK